ncbi:D-glycero-beta-D-manno-heptose-1,7-bisphosphate 7-phosphatase [bacterium HR23]|nr:D-glycero-beta-D-manno-heptose-1,7-bisphosphate 7-phosphatase [bacterium HR23]
MRRAVFLDRDGTLIEEVAYLRDPARVRLLPGTGEALAHLRRKGFALVLVSNQSGIGRGLVRPEELTQVHRRLEECLLAFGVRLDGAFYCPHAPWEGCECRKPRPGLLLQAMHQMGVIAEGSFLVGNTDADIAAGKAVGCTTVLLTLCPDLKHPVIGDPPADYRAGSWEEVVAYISQVGRLRHRGDNKVETTTVWQGDGCRLPNAGPFIHKPSTFE